MGTEIPNYNPGSPKLIPERTGGLSPQEEKIRNEKNEAKQLVRGILGTTDTQDRAGIPTFTDPAQRISFTDQQKDIVFSNPFIIQAVRSEIDRLSPMGGKRGETLALFQLAVHQVRAEKEQKNNDILGEPVTKVTRREPLPRVAAPDLPYYPEERKVVDALFSHLGQQIPLSSLGVEAEISMNRSKGNVEKVVKAYIGLLKKRLEPQGYSIDIDPETQEVMLSRIKKT